MRETQNNAEKLQNFLQKLCKIILVLTKNNCFNLIIYF